MPVSRSEKLLLFSKLLVSSPGECLDRLTTLAQCKIEAGRFAAPHYEVRSFSDNVELLSGALKCDLAEFLNEAGLTEIEMESAERLAPHSDSKGFGAAHNADPALARLCYAVVRALRPDRVLETGVAHGITTAFLLKALETNGTGHLWSIDLPPLVPKAREFVGRAVPERLRSRWTLCRGQSHRILPGLVRQLQPLDIFIHDSLHTYRNETFEFATAWPHLRRGGLLISDDIEAHPAWLDWQHRVQPSLAAVFEEENKSFDNVPTSIPTLKFGIMIKPKAVLN
ncbi:MAG: class I SAM-dependent methyltransferase [Terriglobia bacterium]|nr:class I SAM-dependent methyltransferase [Terriglobia bacterium]